MKDTLAEILLENIEFFSLGPDSEIHPDAAVRQLEIVSSLLRQIPQAELSYFFDLVAKRIQKLRADGASKEQIEVMENLREHLGV